MRSIIATLVLFLSVTCLAQQTLPAPVYVTDPQKITSTWKDGLQTLTIEKLYMTRAIDTSAWSPDGKRVAFVANITGRNNIWLVPAEGGWPRQLTVSEQRQTFPAWSPDGKWISFMSDKDGNEMWDIFVVSTANGDIVNLTNTPNVTEESAAWSHDSRYLTWTVRPKDSPTSEIAVYDTLLRRTKQITKNTAKDYVNTYPMWSKDGKKIAFTRINAAETDASIMVAEVATGEVINATPHDGNIAYRLADWSPDGSKLLMSSNLNGYYNVGIVDLATKKIEWITQDTWDALAGSFTPDGKQITWWANIDGNSEIFLHDLATRMLPLPKGVNQVAGAENCFSSDGSRLLYFHDGPTAPRDLWVYSLKDGKSTQITQSLMAGIKNDHLVEPTLVRYPSKDGKWQISAWVYAPYNQMRDATRPAIVYVHGGPNWQAYNEFNPVIQYLINRGYFIIAPNYRGSTGYGKEFQDANIMDMGGGDLSDVVEAAEWIKRTGFVDPKKVVVMGRSYGGYMTMMAVTKAPEEWAAGVSIVPFVNWFTEVQNEDPTLQQYDLTNMGDPVKNKALWEDRSPINFVDQIKAPLFLMASGNDPRCPSSEAQQVADQIRKRDGKVELKIYQDEGHEMARIENLMDAVKRISDFLEFWVPAPGCGQKPCELAPTSSGSALTPH